MSTDPAPRPDENELIYDWNLADEHVPEPRRVTLDDETLRDGLQSPSVYDPPIADKIEILHLMDQLGIFTANVGLPGAGPRAVEDVTALCNEIKSSKLKIIPNCAARTHINDITPVHEIIQKTGVPIRTACFIGSSPIRQFAEDWDLERMLKASETAVKWCVERDIEVMYVTEDTTRAHPDTIRTLYTEAINNGAKHIVVCDTCGHATPHGVRALIKFVKGVVEATGEDVKVEWHGHNDRGLGLVNAIAAALAGADQLHGAGLGIGERCGNTSMDQLIVNLQLMGWLEEGAHDLTKLGDYVSTVSRAVRVPLPSNYPVFGPDAFETATGVHAAAVIKAFKKGDDWLANRVYSGVPADVFGLEQVISIGPMSGRSNVVFFLEKRGLDASDEVVDRVFDAAKKSSSILTDDEVLKLVGESVPG